MAANAPRHIENETKLIEIRMEWSQLSKEGLSSEETVAVLKSHPKLSAAQKEYHEAVNRLASNPSMVEYVNEVMQDAPATTPVNSYC